MLRHHVPVDRQISVMGADVISVCMSERQCPSMSAQASLLGRIPGDCKQAGDIQGKVRRGPLDNLLGLML